MAEVFLRLYRALPHEAIAGIMDLPIGTVRTHIHRGRIRLARLVRERMTRHDV